MTPSAEPTPEDIERAWSDPKLANVIYHDWEAETYDEKWSISFDERCIDYARDRFAAVAGTDGWPYGKALEIGCGTGFFLLNLKQAGVLDEAHVTDLSPGMVSAAIRNGAALGFDVDGRVADAESIPYDDATFDLVVGHAVLHHIPDVELALREVLRVLKPGGRFVFAGEPTTIGDWYARKLGHLTWLATTRATHLPRCATSGHGRRRSSPSRRVPPCWSPPSTCTPSIRASLRPRHCGQARSTYARRPKSSPPRCSAGRCGPSRAP